jgi:hypothetical protein
VLVDQFGNLLAKGIDGEPGQQGPPGPPGIGQLPPDPYEGAILGWEDGELSWIGGSVPLPAGTYGPFTYMTNEGRLEIPQDVSDLVNGQQIFMSDLNGNKVIAAIQTDTISRVRNSAGSIILTFPTFNNFDKFKVGEGVQGGSSPVYATTSDWSETYAQSQSNPVTLVGGSAYSVTGSSTYWFSAESASGPIRIKAAHFISIIKFMPEVMERQHFSWTQYQSPLSITAALQSLPMEVAGMALTDLVTPTDKRL